MSAHDPKGVLYYDCMSTHHRHISCTDFTTRPDSL